MEFNCIFRNKFTMISSAIICIIPYVTWKAFFTTYRKLKIKYKSINIFQERHNCVVTYQPTNGVKGWPPRINTRIGVILNEENSLSFLYEPILYFIATSLKTLDIAVMILSVAPIQQELILAKRRGVSVRLLLDFQYARNSAENIRNMIHEGIKIQFFVSPTTDASSLMHYKYMVKDYEESGYACIGSMNFSGNSFLANYESCVTTSNIYVVKALQENFQQCWENIQLDNESLINKTVLIDSQLL